MRLARKLPQYRGDVTRSGWMCSDRRRTVTNGVNVQAGGPLWVGNETVTGALTSKGATAIELCRGTFSGGPATSGTTGQANIGGAVCANPGNTFSGSVSITRSTGAFMHDGN